MKWLHTVTITEHLCPSVYCLFTGETRSSAPLPARQEPPGTWVWPLSCLSPEAGQAFCDFSGSISILQHVLDNCHPPQ